MHLRFDDSYKFYRKMNKEYRSTFGFDQFQFLMEKCVLFASPSYMVKGPFFSLRRLNII